jgi:hypothetical protein
MTQDETQKSVNLVKKCHITTTVTSLKKKRAITGHRISVISNEMEI